MNIYIQGRKRIKDVKISEVEDVKKKCDPERSCMRNTVHSHDRVWFKSKVTSAPKYGQLPLKAKNLLTRLLIRTLLSQLHSYINVCVDIVKTTIYRSTIMFDFREEREEKERERERERERFQLFSGSHPVIVRELWHALDIQLKKEIHNIDQENYLFDKKYFFMWFQ